MAQTPLDRHGLLGGQTLHAGLPNEYVDPLSGNLVLVQTDLSLPGNAGLDLSVQRVYNSHVFPDYASGGGREFDEDSWAGVGWKLHFGRVINESTAEPGATQIEMGDGSRHALYSTTAQPGGWITKGFWLYDRVSHAGTSDAQPSPGTVVFDTFKAARGTAAPETILLADDFSAASLNAATWAIAVQSGAQDPAIPVAPSSGQLAIGPLLQNVAGSHYNGVLSVGRLITRRLLESRQFLFRIAPTKIVSCLVDQCG